VVNEYFNRGYTRMNADERGMFWAIALFVVKDLKTIHSRLSSLPIIMEYNYNAIMIS